MKQYIDKDALLADITHKIKVLEAFVKNFDGISDKVEKAKNKMEALGEVILFIDTLEVKEVQEESVSKDLEEAAFDYAEACKYDGGEKLLCVEHFKDGAKWQQLMSNTLPNIPLDLEKEIKLYKMRNPIIGHREESLNNYMSNVAKHFFELGLKTKGG